MNFGTTEVHYSAKGGFVNTNVNNFLKLGGCITITEKAAQNLILVSSPPQQHTREFVTEVHEVEEEEHEFQTETENFANSEINRTSCDPADLSSWPTSTETSPEQV